MRIQSGQLIPLGYGTYVRSDEVTAVQPIVEDRGPGRRAHVWVRGVPEPLVASRSEGAIADDLVTPAEDVQRVEQLRTGLAATVRALEAVPPMLRRVLLEETGVDVAALAVEGRTVLG